MTPVAPRQAASRKQHAPWTGSCPPSATEWSTKRLRRRSLQTSTFGMRSLPFAIEASVASVNASVVVERLPSTRRLKLQPLHAHAPPQTAARSWAHRPRDQALILAKLMEDGTMLSLILQVWQNFLLLAPPSMASSQVLSPTLPLLSHGPLS